MAGKNQRTGKSRVSMSAENTPYEYYNFKVKFLVSDKRDRHENSLRLINRRTLNHRLSSDTCTEKQLRKGSWGSEALVVFDSLDKVWREIIIQQFGEAKKEVPKSYFAKHYVFDADAKAHYLGHRFDTDGDDEQKLALDKVMLYAYQASVLNTVLEVKTNRKAYAKALGGVKLNIWESLSRDVNAFDEVEHHLPTTANSLRYKLNRYRKYGYDALISGKYQNKNAGKVKKDEQCAFLDELIGKHTNLDNEVIAEVYNATAKLMNWKVITSGTVANRKKEKDLISYAGRNGVKSLQNNVLMQVKRRPPSAPLLFWSVDGWDVELLYQKTKVDKDGRRITTYHNRLTVIVVLDPFNKYPIGYAIGTHETPALITEAMKNAVKHSKELFGDFYKTYQLQTDNYAIKKLTPMYESVTKHFTPASVGNAKAKPVESYFGFINKKYCKLYDNWSGHNVDSGSKNQPNDEYLNKIRHQFPDEQGCIKQVISIIEMERAKKIDEYKYAFENAPDDKKIRMSWEEYMLAFGKTTRFKNRLQGDGITITIHGKEHYFDSFEKTFRQHRSTEWTIYFDTTDLSRVLAVSPCTQYRYELEQKYIQPMCIADQESEDYDELKRVRNYNQEMVQMITDERANNANILTELFAKNPQLNDTMGKMLLTNSLGQHKNEKNKERLLKSAQEIEFIEIEREQKSEKQHFHKKQQEYYSSKININDYL